MIEMQFENIRKFLDDYEKALDNYCTAYGVTEKDKDTVEFFDMNFAKTIMKDLGRCHSDERIAKIILASKGLSNEIKVKVE